MRPLEGLFKITWVDECRYRYEIKIQNQCRYEVCCFLISRQQPCSLASLAVFIYYFLLFYDTFRSTSLYLLLDVVLQEGNQIRQRQLHILPIFSSWKADPHLLYFLLSLCTVYRHLLGLCLHLGWLNLLLGLLMLTIEDTFMYRPLETIIWSLFDSLHFLYQLHHIVSRLIRHTFTVLNYFLEVWDFHLGAV